MTEFIYLMLEKIGYTHPLHPAVVHMPIGAAIFALLALLYSRSSQNERVADTAYHLQVFGLIFTPITMFVGYMDWQQFYSGAGDGHIYAKIGLGFVLIICFAANVLLGREGVLENKKFLGGTVACFLVAIAIGFLGGELQYGG